MSRRGPGEFTIGPSAVLASVFGWSGAERRCEKIDASVVPTSLRDLIPLAEQWGVRCDVTRHDVASSATAEQLAAVARTLRGRHDEIVDWLYSFEEGSAYPAEAAAFQALLVFEVEECDGPGMPGYLDWAYRAYLRDPSPARLATLRKAYRHAEACDILQYQDEPTLQSIRAVLEAAGDA